MKIGGEEKSEKVSKNALLNKNEIVVGNVSIRYEKNRLSRIIIDGDFDEKTLEEKVVGLPDSDWAILALKRKISIFHARLKAGHEIMHEKIKELIKNLDIITYLSITEKGISGTVMIETKPDKQSSVETIRIYYVYNTILSITEKGISGTAMIETKPDKQSSVETIRIYYVYNTIERIDLSYIYSDKTKKVLTKVLNMPGLDKINPLITTLSLRGDITKSLNQKLLIDFLNTVNKPISLKGNYETCVINVRPGDTFLYSDNKIYPVIVHMKKTYPKIASFLPEEIRKVYDRFTGLNTIIYFRTSTKKEYDKAFPKALAVLSKLNTSVPLPEYLTFDEQWFMINGITVRGSYEKLDNINFLFKPEAQVLLPIRIIVYNDRQKILVFYRSNASDKIVNLLLQALKKFLGTERIAIYSEDLQEQENSEIRYYLFKYDDYFIVTNKELLPTVAHNPTRFINST